MLLLLTAASSFLATNIDAFAILITLFAQADINSDRQLAVRICIGQLVGFTVILMISLMVAWLGNKFFTPRYVELIGIFPFLLGVWNLLIVFISDDGYEEIPDGPNFEEEDDDNSLSSMFETVETSWFLHSEVFEVAALALACGGDNVILYSALFMSLKGIGSLLTVVLVFYILLMVLLLLAYHVIHLSYVHHWVKHHGRKVVPFIWMVIGCYILQDSVLGDEIRAMLQ